MLAIVQNHTKEGSEQSHRYWDKKGDLSKIIDRGNVMKLGV